MKIICMSVIALVTLASSGAAFAKSPFCYGGSPTPQHVCDVIKANQKPPHDRIERGRPVKRFKGAGFREA
jgi:hypothetical protein